MFLCYSVLLYIQLAEQSIRVVTMNKSETVGALAAALSKLQGEIQDVHKDKAGYGYKYAELSSVLDIARPLCAKYGLAISQLCESSFAEGSATQLLVGVESTLLHSSGEWLSSTLHMPVTAGKGMSLAQAAGSVITYARRYALAALLGIAQTDNDASIKESTVDPIWAQALDKLLDLVHEKKLGDKIHLWCDHFNVKKLSDLSVEQINKLIERIKESN